MDKPGRIPLTVVREEIARPPGDTQIPLAGGTVPLGGGNTFQITSGSVTVQLDTGSFVITAASIRALTDKIEELARQGAVASSELDYLLQVWQNGPAVPAKTDAYGNTYPAAAPDPAA